MKTDVISSTTERASPARRHILWIGALTALAVAVSTILVLQPRAINETQTATTGMSATRAAAAQPQAQKVTPAVIDDQMLHAAVLKDIEKHPRRQRLGLRVEVVKIENGYVTLTAQNCRLDLMPRMEKQEYVGLLDDLYAGREEIRALRDLMEAVKKNRGCKGVYWVELPLARAARMLMRAQVAFDGVWTPLTDIHLQYPDVLPLRTEETEGNTRTNVSLEELKRTPRVRLILEALENPRVLAAVLEELEGKRSSWLPAYEEALAFFPKQQEMWRQVRSAVQGGRFADAGRTLLRLKEAPTGWPYNAHVWEMLPDAIGYSLTSNIERLNRLTALVRNPQKVTVAAAWKNVWGEHEFLILLEKVWEDGHIDGWVVFDAKLPLSATALLGARFAPIGGSWNLDGDTIIIQKRTDAPFDVLFREGDQGLLHVEEFTLFQITGTRTVVGWKDGIKIAGELVAEATDPRILKRIAHVPTKGKIHFAGYEIEARSVGYAVGTQWFYKGHPWEEMQAAIIHSVAGLPEGMLFQVQTHQNGGWLSPGTLLRACTETQERTVSHLEQKDLLLDGVEDSLLRIAVFEPEVIICVTNQRGPGRLYEEQRKALNSSKVPVHVFCWELESSGNGLLPPPNVGEETTFWKDLTRHTGGSFHWVPVSSANYYYGPGPLVEFSTELGIRKGRIYFADADRAWTLTTNSSGRPQTSSGTWKGMKNLRVLQPAPARYVPEGSARWLPRGSLTEKSSPTLTKTETHAP